MLFEPIKINGLEIKNRFCRSATGERLSEHSGHVTDRLISYYEELSKNEIGLIIAGHSYVDPLGKAGYRMSGMYDESMKEGWKKLTAKVRQTGSRIFSQIDHAGGQVAEDVIADHTVAPSAVKNYNFGMMPRELTDEEIERLIESYIFAGKLSKEVGFHGVQIFCSHGYLISQFLSPFINRRNDRWGGSFENRFRFLKKIYLGIREAVGPDYPIISKWPAEDFTDPGLTIEESITAAKWLQENGMDGFEISGGVSSEGKNSVKTPIKDRSQEAYFLPYIKRFRDAGITKPLILVGGIRSTEVMKDLLDNNDVDMVSMCRPFVCEPDFVGRIKEGQEKSGCVNCNQCLHKYTKPTPQARLGIGYLASVTSGIGFLTMVSPSL